jgi:glycosyltransferase involved in cell wall biosynthesis
MTHEELAGRRVLILVENNSVPRDPRVWNESRSLHAAGCEVVVICPVGADDESRPHEQRDGIEIHRFAHRPSSGGVVGYALEYLAASRRIWRLIRRLSADRPFDVVQACNPPDLLLPVARAAGAGGAAFVFDHHDLVPELFESRFGRRGPEHVVARRLEQSSFHLADVVLSTNESYRTVAVTRGGKEPEDVFVVRNGPDPDVLAPSAPVPELKQGKPFLLAYLGIMGPQDGVDHAVRALRALRELRDDWHAVFAGSGDALPGLRRLAAELDLADVVEFPGRIDAPAIADLLSTADVCLAPEPSSPLNDVSTMMKIGEYMSFARPVVAFDLPESRFTAGDAALYAEPNDERQYADRISELLDDEERRLAMGRLGRSRIEERFSWAHSEQSLLRAYARALEKRAPGYLTAST